MRDPSSLTPVLLIGFPEEAARALTDALAGEQLSTTAVAPDILPDMTSDQTTSGVIVQYLPAEARLDLMWVSRVRAVSSPGCCSEILCLRGVQPGRTDQQTTGNDALLHYTDRYGTVRVVADTGDIGSRREEILAAGQRANAKTALLTAIAATLTAIKTARRGIAATRQPLQEGIGRSARIRTVQPQPSTALPVRDAGHDGSPSASHGPASGDAAALTDLFNLTRLRAAHFPHQAFRDQHWAILLQIVLETLNGTPLTSRTVTARCALPTTSARRFLSDLETSGLISRQRQPGERHTRILATREASALIGELIDWQQNRPDS